MKGFIKEEIDENKKERLNKLFAKMNKEVQKEKRKMITIKMIKRFFYLQRLKKKYLKKLFLMI